MRIICSSLHALLIHAELALLAKGTWPPLCFHLFLASNIIRLHRSIDKAGGLDNYVRKIKGTKEDSHGAMEVRSRLGDNKDLGGRLDSQKPASKAGQRPLQNFRRQVDQQLHIRQLEEARRRLRQSRGAGTAADNKESDKNDSTLGWIRSKLGSGFQWK